MKILVLGGTQFIGRHIVETLLAAGHSVSTLNRGRSPDELPPAVERLRGDRDEGNSGLDAVTDKSCDVCIDVTGYTPRQVRPSAERLRDSVHRYVFVSAVRVYGDVNDGPVSEDHERVTPADDDVTELNQETYGRLKVACENIVQEVYADRCTIVRPQIVVGPHDPSGRYTYWLQRARMDGTMLAPGSGSDHLQFIDVRDLARFVRTLIERDLSGTFNLAGPRQTWKAFIESLGALSVAWVPAEILKSATVTEFELPLFRPERGPASGLMNVSNSRAREAGLALTDPEVTMLDTKSWMGRKDFPLALSREREAMLIHTAFGKGKIKLTS